jgi:hypothetical protein
VPVHHTEIVPENGSRDEFSIEIRTSFGSGDAYDLVIWNRSSGNGLATPIRSLDKARRVARFLYATMKPEADAAAAALSARIAETRDERNRAAAARSAELLAQITDDTPRVEMFICPNCDHQSESMDAFAEPVYECSRCGGQQVGEGNNRCEQCNVFMARSDETACESCEGTTDDAIEAVVGVVVDGEFIPATEIPS